MENNFRFVNPNSLGFPFDNGYLNTEPVHRNPHNIEDFTSRNLPLFPISGLQKASETHNSRNWFHFKPNFHQAYAPVLDCAPKEKSPTSIFDFLQQKGPTIDAQKRFLVFDQSGDKTTLLYTSGVHDPVQFGASRIPNPPTAFNSKEQRDTNDHLSLNDENVEDYGTEDEMHENTEELDALLCSDDDSDYSEDDETSTGHSPSTMTDNGIIPNLVEETGEEVDSFSLPTKRLKLSDGGYDVKTVASSALESDAESSSGNGKDSRSSCKRSRKERIHETVSILQTIVPNANGKDTVVVIDEAIRFLKSLKVKAMALGLDSV